MLQRTLLFSFLLFLSAISSSGQPQPAAGREWVALLSGNAIHKADKPGSFSGAKPGLALYYTQAGTIKAPYIVCVPVSYNPARATPVVVFLHGAILARDSFQYADPAIAEEPIFPVADAYNCIVVFPFGRVGLMWPTDDDANENILTIINDVEQHYHVDKKRVYLGGISMGGKATFWFINNRPDIFAGFYTFSAMPAGLLKFGNITQQRPLFSMNAKDDPGISYKDALTLYEQNKNAAPGWNFSSVATGGHRFIYGRGGKDYVKAQIGKLMSAR